ncbi:MAG: MBL fold metallo-hydrolase [Pseudomonadota bacterium]|nr:MBL fold metallo-hydrolase [Pseudomonadota bacterium]
MSSQPTAEFGPVTVFFGEKTGKYPDGNQVIVAGGDMRVAFDTPPVANRIGPAFDEVDMVILGHVHEDHMAGLHRVPHAPVHVHEDDVAAARSWEGLSAHFGYDPAALEAFREKIEREFNYVPRPDAIPYRDGARWDLGGGVSVEAIHMPGHTRGHCVLLVQPGGIAFIGDIDLTGFGPYYGDATSDLGAFRRSIERLPSIPAKVWITSHHRGVYTDRDRMLADLQAYASKLDAREEKILGLLAEGPRRLADLVGVGLVYPVDYQSPMSGLIEARTVERHLDELLAAGRVACGGDGAWRISGH